MKKIAFLQTIGDTYRFVFVRFLGNLGVTWLPLALLAVLLACLLPSMLGQWLAVMGSFNTANRQHPPLAAFAALGGIYRLLLLLALAQMFIRAQIMTGLTARALGLPGGARFVYLNLGFGFWRVFAAYIAAYLILVAVEIVAMVGFVVAVAVAAGLAHSFGHGSPLVAALLGLGSVVLGAAFAILMLYIAVRLTFLLTAAIVAEGRFDLLEPWETAGGNFWRIVGIGLAVLLPLALLSMLIIVPLEFGALVPALRHLPLPHPHPTPQEAMQTLRMAVEALAGVARRYGLLLLPLYIVLSTLTYSALAGAGAFAWRSVKA